MVVMVNMFLVGFSSLLSTRACAPPGIFFMWLKKNIEIGKQFYVLNRYIYHFYFRKIVHMDVWSVV